MSNPLRIEHMTVFDAEPAEVVTIAAELGVPLISIFASQGMQGAPEITPAYERDLLQRLGDTGVAVDTVEAFMLVADPRVYEAQIALAGRLGAKAVVALNYMTADESEAAEQLAGFCELADGYGLLVSVEPIAMGATRTASDGVRLLGKAGADNARLTLDLLHVVRTGTSVAELSALDPKLISSAQVCDGPLQQDPALINDEAAYARMIPGTGEFPVEDFLAGLPAGVSLGMEVPLRPLREQGVSALERSRRVVEQTRALQATAVGS